MLDSRLKLAVSNIAWPREADRRVAALLSEAHVERIEVAPTRQWLNPVDASAADVLAYVRYLRDMGLTAVSLQALLFGRDDLQLFGDEETREQTGRYLERIIALAAQLGATRLVFGSPRNRRKGMRGPDEAERIALPFFRQLGDCAARHKVILCLEPNPPEYGCDFLTTAAEGLTFVDRVSSSGFGLHLDAGAMTLSNESPRVWIPRAAHALAHFHISEPFLGPLGATTDGTDHAAFGEALRTVRYTGIHSIEMREVVSPADPAEAVVNAIKIAQDLYGSASAVR